MGAGKEFEGFEPLFAAGVLAAVSVQAGPAAVYSIASAAHIVAISLACLLFSLRHTDSSPVRIMTAALLAVISGASCGLTGRIVGISGPANGPLIQAAGNIGAFLEDLTDSIGFQDPDTNALIKALLTGNRNDIPQSITRAFRESGASHILALSGLHLGIIYGIIRACLSILGNRKAARTVRSLIIMASCGIYTLATGASASITRALTFILLKETGKMAGRNISLKDTLMRSLLIQLTICPTDILDIGFQLSYAAMAGIVWIYPVLRKIWSEESGSGILKRVWESAALSISCQLTTGPLAYIRFGTFPQYFILTNLMALPLTGLLIPVSIATVLLTAAGHCPEFLIKVTEWTAGSLTGILEIISSM